MRLSPLPRGSAVGSRRASACTSTTAATTSTTIRRAASDPSAPRPTRRHRRRHELAPRPCGEPSVRRSRAGLRAFARCVTPPGARDRGETVSSSKPLPAARHRAADAGRYARAGGGGTAAYLPVARAWGRAGRLSAVCGGAPCVATLHGDVNADDAEDGRDHPRRQRDPVGKIVDRQPASYLCRELRGLGVEVRRITVIPDDVDLIAVEVARLQRRLRTSSSPREAWAHARRLTIEAGPGGGRPSSGIPRWFALPARLLPRTRSTRAHLKMAEVAGGRRASRRRLLALSTILMRNVYILPGLPEIFRRKFDALRERFRDQPIFLKNVFVSIGRGASRTTWNALVARIPVLWRLVSRVSPTGVQGQGHARVARSPHFSTALSPSCSTAAGGFDCPRGLSAGHALARSPSSPSGSS